MMRFRNRHHAGQLLAHALLHYKGQDGVVYALPRGGVPLAVEIAAALDMPVELLITRKIGHPNSPEYAICAVSENGALVCNEDERRHVPADWLARRVTEERAEAVRRRSVYRGGIYTSARDRLAIVVDDGVATGLTMLAAIRELQQQQPRAMVVAVPVTPADTAEWLKREAGNLVAIDIPSWYAGSVGAYYQDFAQLTDEEVIAELEGATTARHHPPMHP